MDLPSLPTQNRRVVRLRCNYQVSCSMLGRRFAAQVVDMGLEGMKLQLPCPMEPGQRIGVRYEGPLGCYDFDTVTAHVVWARPREGGGSEIGVAYTHAAPYLERSWVRHLLRVFDLDKVSVTDRRRDVRMPVETETTVRVQAAQARLRDIGPGGALIESSTDFALGSCVTIEVDGVTCTAHVVRKSVLHRPERWLVGVRFAGASHALQARVQAVLSRQGTA